MGVDEGMGVDVGMSEEGKSVLLKSDHAFGTKILSKTAFRKPGDEPLSQKPRRFLVQD